MTRRRLGAFAACILLLAGCGDDGSDFIGPVDPDDEAAVRFEQAVERENGLVPIVVDFDLIDPGAPVVLTRTPDPIGDDVLRLVARDDDTDRPLIGFDIQPGESADLAADIELGDGRTVEVRSESPPSVDVAGDEGQFVNVASPMLDLDALLEVVAGSRIAGDELSELPEGWSEVGSVLQPTWLDGYSIAVELEVDFARAYFVTVERSRGDREALVRYGPTEPVDIGTDGWAYRFDPDRAPPGYVFEHDDDRVIQITGDLNDEQFRMLIDSVRDAEPGEIEIREPTPLP